MVNERLPPARQPSRALAGALLGLPIYADLPSVCGSDAIAVLARRLIGGATEAIAALVFGAIERGVGPHEQGVDIRHALVRGRTATLTVAPMAWPSTVAPAPGKRRADVRRSAARSIGSGTMATNSSPPSRPTMSVARMLLRATCANSRSTLVAGRVTEAVIDRFEMIEIEHQQRHRFAARTLGARTYFSRPRERRRD